MSQDFQEPVQTSTDPLDKKWIDVNIPCQAACPIMTDIPGYIQAIMQGDYERAYRINRMDNVLPGVLGRVCHRPCENVCRHGRDGLGDPVAICFLKRSAADFGMKPWKPEIKKNGKTVCIIGAGPSGLTAANDLALKGYHITVLEQYAEPGGMLRYGIPEFRLPRDVVAGDVKSVTDLGVEIKTNERIDSWESLVELRQHYDAVILAGGCQLPKKVDIPGADADGFYWGLDFMMAANEDEINRKFENVVVIGGGFTAVDCTRMAYRLGAKNITLAYRRTQDDMSVSAHEIEAMREEDINLEFLASPVGIETENGKVKAITLIRNSIDTDRSVHAIPGSEFTVQADCVISAIGQQEEGELLEKEKSDHIYIAGDFRNGASTVIEAAADGRKIARQVHLELSGIAGYLDIVEINPVRETGRERDYDFISRQPMPVTPLDQRQEKNKEVELGFSEEKSLIEARRCYLCFYNFQIDIDRCIYCLKCIDVMPVDCIKMAKDVRADDDGNINYVETKLWSEVQAIVIDNDQCIRCSACARACPVDCISISKYSLKTREE